MANYPGNDEDVGGEVGEKDKGANDCYNIGLSLSVRCFFS
jgi:hypothetical protein